MTLSSVLVLTLWFDLWFDLLRLVDRRFLWFGFGCSTSVPEHRCVPPHVPVIGRLLVQVVAPVPRSGKPPSVPVAHVMSISQGSHTERKKEKGTISRGSDGNVVCMCTLCNIVFILNRDANVSFGMEAP